MGEKIRKADRNEIQLGKIKQIIVSRQRKAFIGIPVAIS